MASSAFAFVEALQGFERFAGIQGVHDLQRVGHHGRTRTAEAVRRALPELVRLNRYERRAAARRDRAIRTLTQSED